MTTTANPCTAAPMLLPATRRPINQPWAVLAAAIAGGLVLGWQGGWLGALGTAGVLAVGLGLPWLKREGHQSDAAAAALDPSGPPPANGGRIGAEVMVSQVVPAWCKQLDIGRDAAADGLGSLRQRLAQVAGDLATLNNTLAHFSPRVEAGAANGSASDTAAALARLLAPSQRAFAQRDAAVAELAHFSQALDGLRQAGQDAREIGKHTRLVAFNASIEAQRGSTGGANGAVAVALETRALADRMAEVGARIGKTVTALNQTLAPQRLHGEIGDTTDDELKLELDLRAREALTGLLGPMADARQGSAEIEQASQRLRSQVDGLVAQCQVGDRLAQMLSLVGADMAHFARWVGKHPHATQTDAAAWLAKLEASYTTDEQRARHHGNLYIDRSATTGRI